VSDESLLPANHHFSCYIDLNWAQCSDPGDVLELRDGMGQVSWTDPGEVKRFNQAVQASRDLLILRKLCDLPTDVQDDQPRTRRTM
jgi:hypothetical protein